jgi:heat shock protein HslJ
MGEFEEADGKITFKNIVSTKMMGAPEDMEAEAAFFEALEANTFQDGKFLTADGVTFIRA